MISITEIKRRISEHSPAVLDLSGNKHAAVAMILRQGTEGAEALFIERARHPEIESLGERARRVSKKQLAVAKPPAEDR